jgi:hypothetical protein
MQVPLQYSSVAGGIGRREFIAMMAMIRRCNRLPLHRFYRL